jgi:ribosomal protein S18 acetylase RimI-like enzyme
MPTDTQPTGVVIRRAQPADAARLAEFAARTFSETFAADNSAENMALHLARTYGTPQQTGEIANPGMITIVAEFREGLAGYAQLREGPAPDGVQGKSPIELLRFYVDRPWHGQGLARRLMRAVDEEAIRHGASTLWLAVWERNERAKAFYAKCGFADVGSKVFMLGNDKQRDRVMARSVTG